MALNPTDTTFKSVVALAGGVGGAKFADGLMRCLPPGALTVIVNTGDDFRHYGLAISPDLDTVMYTLGGVANPVTGWGVAGDTTQMLDMLRRYGDDPWFGLGDKDLATHLLRSQWLAQGMTLTEVTRRLAQALGIPARLLPMSNDPAPTMINTLEYGLLPFQEYFVRYRWQPTLAAVEGESGGSALSPIRFQGDAAATPETLDALRSADLIVICPSNPMLSVDPILTLPGVRALIENRHVPCIAISPIIGGTAVKGPAAKIMAELSMEASAASVARYYGPLIDGVAVDQGDQAEAAHVLRTDILMRDAADRVRLAKEVLEWLTTWIA